MKLRMIHSPIFQCRPSAICHGIFFAAGIGNAAKAALAKAKTQVPTSLSEIPAGSKAHHDEAEALMEMSDGNTLSSFMAKSPEQIRALLERAL